jgi:zinc transporter ZupT
MVVWTLSTAIPALLGLAIVSFIGGRFSRRFLAAFALGIFIWFFLDTIQGSSNLSVSRGLSGGLDLVLPILLFGVGLLVFFRFDRGLFSESVGSPLFVPLLAALALGFHGFGEGSAVGLTAAQTSSSSFIGAFGGLQAGLAYVLHKVLEPMMVGALYVARPQPTGETLGRSLRAVSVLALVFVLPSLVGAAVGYFSAFDTTYVFAFSSGTATYVAFRLARQIFGEPAGARGDAIRTGLAFMLGFILIYGAALLHS